nr:unnamed protein product [Callosobruchus analis]
MMILVSYSQSINSSKSAIIVFGKDRNLIEKDINLVISGERLESKSAAQNLVNLPITINDEIIERKTILENLGVILDDNMRFSDHIKHKLQSAYLCINTIYQNRQYLSMSMKKMLCDSLVLSQMTVVDKVTLR